MLHSGSLHKAPSKKLIVFGSFFLNLAVLFFGPSVIHYSVYPMQLWHDYGITSYNMGNDSERLTMTYYTLLNALDYCQPKAVVIDLTAMGWAGSRRDGTYVDHDFLDALPLSRHKVAEINSLFEGKERIEYLFPFYLYHSRWNELDDRDFFRHRYVQHGAEFLYGAVSVGDPEYQDMGIIENKNTLYEMENLDKMIRLCQEKNITPIFIYITNGSPEKIPLRRFCAEQLAARNAIFYDLMELEGLDRSRDFSDNSHLNYFGGSKLTDYLGRLLSQEFSIPDHREDPGLANIWDADYTAYLDLVDSYLADNLPLYNESTDSEE